MSSYYRPIRLKYNINYNETNSSNNDSNKSQKIDCIFYTAFPVWPARWQNNPPADYQIALIIRYKNHFHQVRQRSITFPLNSKTVSGISNISYKNFIQMISKETPSTNKFFIRYVLLNLNMEELYKTYHLYMRQVIGQFGA